MGWNNAWLRDALDQAKKSDDSEERARLRKLVNESQGRCGERGHPGPRNVKFLARDKGRYKAGGRIEFCLLCDKITGYETPEQVDEG